MEKIIIFDLLGVITKEPMFATNIIYPLVKDKISYDLFKKKYLLYAIGTIEKKDFWEFICTNSSIEKFENRIIKETIITFEIKKIINDLVSSGCVLYLATEIPKRWGELLLEKAGIKAVFKKKFYSSDLLVTKPFSDFYKKVFKEIKGDEIYYIDDTLINLIAAKKIKKHTAIYYSIESDQASCKEMDYKINNLKKIIEICGIKK
ncbi:HAD hydrolase-like protein [Candidatus Falkowbacteria bacterium]|nr:HAD hydrolase-like protein [Candidatus Falkowbacteria bacterium]